MKIVSHDTRSLKLSGISGGSAAIVVPLGFILIGGLALLFWAATHTPIPLVVGTLMLLVGTVAGVITCTSREKLSLDLTNRRGRHEVSSLIGARRKPVEFAFDRIESIALERAELRTPGRGAGTTVVWTARLRLVRPRRAITLVESQGGCEQPVRALAESIASALGIAITDLAGDTPQRIQPDALHRLLSSRPLSEVTFGSSPPGARVVVHIDPARETVALEWKTIGGPALPVLGLLLLSLFALVSTAMLLEATGIVPVLSWLFGGAATSRHRASPAILVFLAAMCAATWLAISILLQTWLWSRRRLVITTTEIRLQARSPLTRLFGILRVVSLRDRWAIPLADIRSVRTRDDTIEVRGANATCQALIHLPREGETAWAAHVVRTAIGVLGRPINADSKDQ